MGGLTYFYVRRPEPAADRRERDRRPAAAIPTRGIVSASPTASTPALDSNMFPHILDMIVDEAPYAALVSLRAANRRLRRRCDAMLARHLVLSNRVEGDDQGYPVEGSYGPVNVFAPEGRLPIFMEWDMAYYADLGEEEADKDDDGPDSLWFYHVGLEPVLTRRGHPKWVESTNRLLDQRRYNLTQCLRITRVLDFVGPVPNYRARELMNGPSHSVTLRFIPDSEGINPWSPLGTNSRSHDRTVLQDMHYSNASSVITFQHLNGPRAPRFAAHRSSGGSREDYSSDIRQVDRPHSNTPLRVVNTFLFTAGRIANAPRAPSLPEYPTDVIYIFLRNDPVTQASGATPTNRAEPSATDGPAVPPEKLFDVLALSLRRKLTLVNVESLDPTALGLSDDFSATEALAEITSIMSHNVHELCRNPPTVWNSFGQRGRMALPSPGEMMSNLTIMSLNEYRAMVGEDRFALETVESRP